MPEGSWNVEDRPESDDVEYVTIAPRERRYLRPIHRDSSVRLRSARPRTSHLMDRPVRLAMRLASHAGEQDVILRFGTTLASLGPANSRCTTGTWQSSFQGRGRPFVSKADFSGRPPMPAQQPPLALRSEISREAASSSQGADRHRPSKYPSRGARLSGCGAKTKGALGALMSGNYLKQLVPEVGLEPTRF